MEKHIIFLHCFKILIKIPFITWLTLQLVEFGCVYFQFVPTIAQSVMGTLEQTANYRQQENCKPIYLTHLAMFNLTARQHYEELYIMSVNTGWKLYMMILSVHLILVLEKISLHNLRILDPRPFLSSPLIPAKKWIRQIHPERGSHF